MSDKEDRHIPHWLRDEEEQKASEEKAEDLIKRADRMETEMARQAAQAQRDGQRRNKS